MKSESCLALHVNTNPNYEETNKPNKALNLGPELETSSMSFVVAGISWIGSKSTRNKVRRTKGATALHWGRGKAPLGECWAPALRRAGAQVHACNPFSSQREVKMSSWTLSHLHVLTRHLSKHRKFCLSQLWPDSLSEPCSQPQPKPQTVSVVLLCVHPAPILTSLQPGLPSQHTDHCLLRISSPLKLKLMQHFVLAAVLLTSASRSSIQMDSSPWCLMKWSKRGTPKVIGFFFLLFDVNQQPLDKQADSQSFCPLVPKKTCICHSAFQECSFPEPVSFSSEDSECS